MSIIGVLQGKGERSVQTVIHNIQESTTSSLVNAIQNTYQNALPLLPLTELPVFAVSGADALQFNSSCFLTVRHRHGPKRHCNYLSRRSRATC
jgi:hypothetical protein